MNESVIEKPRKPGLPSRFKEKLKQYKRVMGVSRKPDKDELKSSIKITGSGILFLGLIGFIIFLLYFFIIRLVGG